MSRNVELLERTMQFIEDNPEEHDQLDWRCCFAGTARMLSGRPLAWGNVVGEDAQNLLGLDDADAERLFHAANTREMLKLMVKDLLNGDALLPVGDYVP